MSWLDNYVKPRIQQLVRRTPPPADMWRQCPECAQMLFGRDLEEAGMVCPNCAHHMRIGAEARFELLFDAGSREDLDLGFLAEYLVQPRIKPLDFSDRRKIDRILPVHHRSRDSHQHAYCHSSLHHDHSAAVLAHHAPLRQ